MRIMLQLDGKPTRRPGRQGRPQAGLRLALLSLATAILLLGAVIAGIFCSESFGHGTAHGSSAAPRPTEVRPEARQSPISQAVTLGTFLSKLMVRTRPARSPATSPPAR